LSGLGEVLHKLAQVLPERFKFSAADPDRFLVHLPHTLRGDPKRWLTIFYRDEGEWELEEIDGYMWLEFALREECEARDWPWVTQQFMKKWHPDRGCKALVYRPGLPVDSWGKQQDFLEAEASTPAHALAMAFLAALAPAPAEAEQQQGNEEGMG